MLDELLALGAMEPARASGPLRLRADQVGPGYTILTPEARRALIDAAQFEGMFLDPVYTAKALSGLAAAVKDGSIKHDERTVFVHTGGLPGLFGHEFMRDPRGAPEAAKIAGTGREGAASLIQPADRRGSDGPP
jgi:D-cysteine desulfhydrase